jgi:hypothetical protein
VAPTGARARAFVEARVRASIASEMREFTKGHSHEYVLLRLFACYSIAFVLATFVLVAGCALYGISSGLLKRKPLWIPILTLCFTALCFLFTLIISACLVVLARTVVFARTRTVYGLVGATVVGNICRLGSFAHCAIAHHSDETLALSIDPALLDALLQQLSPLAIERESEDERKMVNGVVSGAIAARVRCAQCCTVLTPKSAALYVLGLSIGLRS